MQLVSYQEGKKQLLEVFRQLNCLAEDVGLSGQRSNLKKDMCLLDGERFELVVVGEFSRGKSTFVNAMLGRRILPTNSKPTTAIISKIVYGETPKFVLHYKNGDSKEIDEDKFIKLVAPKETDETKSEKFKKFLHFQESLDKIDYAEVQYPLTFCRDNVEVVDTPGTNDLNAGRIEITYKYLNQADAVIMLLAADQALTASEEEFLKARIMGNQIRDIFFVVNGRDKLGGSSIEEERVMNFVRENLQELEGLSGNLRLYLLSSRQALLFRRSAAGEELKPKQLMMVPDLLENTGFTEFEAQLGNFLAVEKGRAKLYKYAVRAIKASQQIAQGLALQMDMAEHSADEIRVTIAALEPEFRKAELKSKEISGLMRSQLKNTEHIIENMCVVYQANLCKVALNAFDDCNSSDKDVLQHAVEKAVTQSKMAFVDEVGKKQHELFSEQIKKANDKYHKIWQDLKADYHVGMNLPMKIELSNEAALSLDISVSEDNDVEFISTLAIGAGIGAVIAGAALAPVVAIVGGLLWLCGSSSDNQRDKARREINQHYQKEAENTKKQVIAQYCSMEEQMCKVFEEMADEKLKDMQGELEKVLHQKENKEKDAADLCRELENKQVLLRDLQVQLKGFLI